MKRKIIITILIILSVTIFLLRLIDKYVSPILYELASSETKNLTTILINESVRNNSKNIGEDIINVNTNKDGVISSIDFNIPKINSSLYDITNDIIVNFRDIETNNVNTNIELLKKYDNIIYRIPIGVIFGNSILSSLGPKIPISASLIGEVKSNVKTDITPYGINNSLVKIYVSVESSSMIILPFTSKRYTNNVDVLIGMKMIQGVVPEYYGSMLSSVSPLVKSNVDVLE